MGIQVNHLSPSSNNDKSLLKLSSTGARVPLPTALAPRSSLCLTPRTLALAGLSRVLRVPEHLGPFSNLPPA